MHIIIGLAGLWATLVSTRSHMPNGFTGFFHPAALILLLGAPPSILLVGHDVREIWRGVVTLAQALRYHARRAESRMIADLYRFGRELKQGRTVEASKVLADAEDPLLREVGPLLLQPGGGADARETVLTLSYARLSQVKEAEEVFRFLARTTPAVGLMGTIVGLVNMLINLKNFEQLGPAMAVAHRTTCSPPSPNPASKPASTSVRNCSETAPNVTSGMARWIVPALCSWSQIRRRISRRRCA